MRWSAALAVALAGAACGSGTQSVRGIGEPCTPSTAADVESPECSEKLCVALDTASGFCTRNCDADSKCPDGFACEAAGRYGRICRKVTGCKVDTDCPSGHVCDAESRRCYIKVQRTLCSPCQDVKQCPEGGACFQTVGSGEQFCTAPCGAAGECPSGFDCKDIPAGPNKALIKQCVPHSETCNYGKPLCAPCQGDSECGGALDLCVRNVVSGERFCGRDCDPAKNVCPAAMSGCDPKLLDSATNADCPSGFACTNIGKSDDVNVRGPYQCVPTSNTCVNFCGALSDLGQVGECGLGKQCTANHCEAASDGRQCAPCFNSDDCRKGSHTENRCIENDCPNCQFKGETFCATPCADDAACFATFGPGFVCKQATEMGGATQKFCVPQRGTCKSGLGKVGADCSRNAAQDCVSGVCLHAGLTSLCSAPCANDAQCADSRYRCCESTAAGYDCDPSKRTATGPKAGIGVCAPTGGLFGDDCSPGRSPCQTGTCLDLGTARLCTVTCAGGAACPEGFACRQALLAGQTTNVDVCFPVGGGKVGADCAFGPAACESGLCIRKDSGPVCSSACKADTDCPTDWSCQMVSAVTNQSVQACIPPSLL